MGTVELHALPVATPAHSGGDVLRILLVCRETSLLNELIDYIVDLGETWQLHHVTSGNEAITASATYTFDAVIAAPNLPDLSCATLLGQIRTLRPETIRIALLDPADDPDSSAARIIGVAHRLLPLPPSPELLLETLTSLEELRDLLANPTLCTAIGRIDKLPAPPHLYLDLMQALEDDAHNDAANIAKLVSADAAITAKVLQLCNSAYFTGGRSIIDLRSAVTRLGIATLRQLVLASEVFSLPALSPAQRSAMQQRALLSARIAAKILPASSAELGATAALLADIGLLLPGVRNEREASSEDDPRPAHTEAGAYLLGLWGLPMPIIEAVALQLKPQRSSTRSFWVSGAVHVAVALAQDAPVDEQYLANVGVLAQLPAWRAQAVMLREAAGY